MSAQTLKENQWIFSGDVIVLVLNFFRTVHFENRRGFTGGYFDVDDFMESGLRPVRFLNLEEVIKACKWLAKIGLLKSAPGYPGFYRYRPTRIYWGSIDRFLSRRL